MSVRWERRLVLRTAWIALGIALLFAVMGYCFPTAPLGAGMWLGGLAVGLLASRRGLRGRRTGALMAVWVLVLFAGARVPAAARAEEERIQRSLEQLLPEGMHRQELLAAEDFLRLERAGELDEPAFLEAHGYEGESLESIAPALRQLARERPDLEQWREQRAGSLRNFLRENSSPALRWLAAFGFVDVVFLLAGGLLTYRLVARTPDPGDPRQTSGLEAETTEE